MKTASLGLVIFLAFANSTTGALTKDKADIRSIDFKNFSFEWDDDAAAPPSFTPTPWHWIDSKPKSHIRVTNGIHHFYEPGQSRLEHEHSPLISVDSVTYGDLDGDGAEEAAVHLNYSTGGTLNWDYVYVYRFVRGHARLLGILECGSRGYGGLVRSTIQDGVLVTEFTDPERAAGDCCSEGYVRVRYRWSNGVFAEQGQREHGDLNRSEH
jgi:hypothetical protein